MVRRYLADTLAMVVFSTVCGAFIEIVIAGLSIGQSMRIRIAAIFVILFAGRPYGVYRDWLFKVAGGAEPGELRSGVLDTFANFSFQISLYLVLLFINGATLAQALKAASSIVVFLIISGRPYGLFLNYCRRLFGVSES